MEKENRYKLRIKISILNDDGTITINEHHIDELNQDTFDDAMMFLLKEQDKYPKNYLKKQKNEYEYILDPRIHPTQSSKEDN
jgi:hypothetical protein